MRGFIESIGSWTYILQQTLHKEYIHTLLYFESLSSLSVASLVFKGALQQERFWKVCAWECLFIHQLLFYFSERLLLKVGYRIEKEKKKIMVLIFRNSEGKFFNNMGLTSFKMYHSWARFVESWRCLKTDSLCSLLKSSFMVHSPKDTLFSFVPTFS